MQLIYVYIDEYCAFHQVEFNFSSEIHLSFDEEKSVVTVSESQSTFPKEFWGKNIRSLTAVVGNNGAGKTSLMQYIIDLFLEAHGGRSINSRGILIFSEDNVLYVYHSIAWETPPDIVINSKKYYHAQLLKQFNLEPLCKTKLIYLTNILTRRDSTRNQWYKSSRTTPFYDCSAGSVFMSDTANDANQTSRATSVSSAELETYFLYEQYKQIKFVFDRRQHQICTGLKAMNYPVPVPERLYIELSLDNHLRLGVSDKDNINFSMGPPFFDLDKKIFPDLDKLQKGIGLEQCDPYDFLRKELSRCAIWCAVRSATKTMSSAATNDFRIFILEKDIKWYSMDYITIFQTMWKKMQSINKQRINQSKSWFILNSCYDCYIEFLRFVETEPIEKHFKIESNLRSLPQPNIQLRSITFSVGTSDTNWFIEFIQKYRYICNPDYFLDFSWGLSSGENSLLSLFASLYYIYGADYSNPKNGDFQIWNQFERNGDVQCNSVILLIDEADLTYHPEWQRLFIDLLMAFLPQVYPPQCCQDIQVILTTHSPILLSDIPQQCIIYLKHNPETCCTQLDDSQQMGTFGQNIHLLYKNSFFLKHGTIGSFARRKMDKLLGELQKIEKLLELNEEKGFRSVADKSEHQRLPYAGITTLEEAQVFEDSQRLDKMKDFSALLDKLEHQCRPCAELIAEPIIRRRVLTWIADLERKLEPAMRDNRLRKMTDAELKQALDSLQDELNRRRYD